MVPGKLDNVMEVSPTMMEKNGKSVKFPEEKMMICTRNCEDNIFDDDATKGLEEKLMMTCENNCQENTFHMEVSPSGHDSTMASKGSDEDVEVDILDNVDQDEARVTEAEPRYVTESSSSSSFGCTEDSRIGSGAVSSDVEVESQVRDNTRSLLGFNGYSDLFRSRKKKLTAHWRKFVCPLMWRCKWVELQIRELHSQACKYDRELSECEKSKQSQLEKCATKEMGMKSVPFISQNLSVKLMKRKKGKRVEETVDIPSYMSCHSLFSYYASRRPITDSVYMDDDHDHIDVVPLENTPFGNDEFGTYAEWESFELKDSTAFESILRKIEEVELQVHQLRVRTDKVVQEHAGKFTSDNSSFTSVLPHVNAEKIPSGSVYTTSQLTSEKKLPMDGNAVLSCGDVTPLPDTVESTEQPQRGGKCEKMEHEILIHNQPVKEELNNIEEVGNQGIAESQLATKGKAGNVQHVPDSNSGKMPVNREQSTFKIRSISKLISPKNKRKRGRRRARSSSSRRLVAFRITGLMEVVSLLITGVILCIPHFTYSAFDGVSFWGNVEC